MVLVTRLREPLSFYVSFYQWTVAWRQAQNASKFGSSMLECACPRPERCARLDAQQKAGEERESLRLGLTLPLQTKRLQPQFDNIRKRMLLHYSWHD